jgi:hypothetical protein
VSSDNENQLVSDLQKHAKEHHKMILSRDRCSPMAQPDSSAAASAKHKG